MSSGDLEDLQGELETKLRQALLREQEQRLRKRVQFFVLSRCPLFYNAHLVLL